MAETIEIKVNLQDVAFCMEKAGKLSGNTPKEIVQKDYFFNCVNI
jgi:adenylate cyclase class IV